MKPHHSFPHAKCKNFITEHYIGFKLHSIHKGETNNDYDNHFHHIIFILEGELLLSYDSFPNKHFRKGDILFIPQASNRYGQALQDCYLLLLIFDLQIDSLCDTCAISQLMNHTILIEYDFCALQMTDSIWDFVQLMRSYITKDIHCAFLHKTKLKELFVLLQFCYTKEEIIKLFYPITGFFNFKSWVLANYRPQVSITELAQKQNMTTKSFSRKFKKEFHDTFRNWTLHQKAKQIRHRLSMPETTFNDIIRDFNFSDLRCFYNFCKVQYGCTATELVSQVRQ